MYRPSRRQARVYNIAMKHIAIATFAVAALVIMPATVPTFASSAHAYTPKPLSFPADTAMHPAQSTEWWYLVGQLADRAGHRYSFEITLFKFAGLRRYFPGSPVDLAFRSDVALTDETARRFHHGITYVAADPPHTIAGTRRLRLRAGAIDMATTGVTPLRYRVQAALPDGRIALSVTSLRAPMLVDGGFLSWGSGYTYYYSLTHMTATGALTIGGHIVAVAGTAWMDHQWGTMSASNVTGWDWMEMQLGDHTDLSLVDERPASVLDARWTMALLPDGRQQFVPQAIITPLGRWRSPHTGVTYPSGWRVRVPKLRLDVVVTPTIPDQEVWDGYAVGGYRQSYWEGSCTITGTRAGRRITGKGYTELTGYGTPPPAPQL